MPDFQIYRSESRSWAQGATISFSTAFLDPARKMVAPEIESIDIHAVLTVNTAAANTALGGMFAQTFDKVQIADPAGDRVNLRGTSLRQVQWMEYGEGYQDPANVSPSQAGATVDGWLRIPIHPLKARRRADFRIPLQEFLDGGLISLYCKNAALIGGTNAQWTITAGTFEIVVRVVEARNRELKSRACWIDYDMTQQEFSYPVGGSLRYAAAYVGESGEFVGAQTTWGTTQQISSRTLDLSNIPYNFFRTDYLRKSFSVNSSLDGVANNFLLPVYAPHQDQKTPQLADMATLHFKTDTALPATSPKMIVCSITDRSPTLSMRTWRQSSQAGLSKVLNNNAYVKTAQGTMKSDKVQNWGDYLPRRLPLKAM